MDVLVYSTTTGEEPVGLPARPELGPRPPIEPGMVYVVVYHDDHSLSGVYGSWAEATQQWLYNEWPKALDTVLAEILDFLDIFRVTLETGDREYLRVEDGVCSWWNPYR